MWMIYGKRTKEPYVDKQFRMLTANGFKQGNDVCREEGCRSIS